jgi:hypothetical protein
LQPKVLDIWSELRSLDFGRKSYDVLIAPVGVIPKAEIDVILRRLLSLLESGGKIILTEPHSTVVARSRGKYLVQSAFAEPDASFGDKKSAGLASSVPSRDSKASTNGLSPTTASGGAY